MGLYWWLVSSWYTTGIPISILVVLGTSITLITNLYNTYIGTSSSLLLVSIGVMVIVLSSYPLLSSYLQRVP